LEQVWHWPLVHADIAGQLCCTQVVQPAAGSTWQVSTAPLAAQRVAPLVQALLQQVAVLRAIWLSAPDSEAWLLTA
jgi:hypothetical protein